MKATLHPGPRSPSWAGFPQRRGRRLQVSLLIEADQLPPGTAEHPVMTNAAVWHYLPTRRAAQSSGAAPQRLLMLHGFRGDHHGMQLVVNALPEYEVFVPDLPGFGATPPLRSPEEGHAEHTVEMYAAVVEALAHQLDLSAHDVLIGHSFGTIIAAAHAAREPHRWGALVLAAPISNSVFSGRLLPGGAAVELYYRLCAALPHPAATALLRSAVALEVTNRSMAVEWTPEMAAYIRDQHSRHFGSFTDRLTVLQAYRASSRHTVTELAAQLELPVLLLPGTKDQLSTPAGQRRLRDALPDAQLEPIRGTGHLMHYEKPVQAARAIRRFLTSLPASTAQ